MSKIVVNKSNVNTDYPICRPSLDLDFTQEVLDERITFSRGSIGTRVNRNRLIETVPANQPRFDYDPVTGECKGLLIEESRQNLLTYSEQFDNAAWTKSKLGITTNTTETLAPNGTYTAEKIVEDNTNNQHLLLENIAGVTTGSVYTLSCFAKTAERTQISLTSQAEGYSVYDLSNGTVISTGGNSNVTITPYGNGWYRCSATITKTNGTGNFYIVLWNNTNNYQGDGTSGIYIWGAQLEAGTFPTSYIPTSGSTVTRSVDNASMTGANFSSWYNQTEGTFCVNAKSNASVIGDIARRFLEINDNTTQRITLEYISSTQTRFIGLSSSSSVFFDLRATGSANNSLKMSGSYGGSGYIQSTNGILSSKNSNNFLIAPTQLNIGYSPIGGSNSYLGGTISRLTYYPRALNPNQLQLLTA